jgi:CDGSH-type Zn-finger protein
MPDTTITVRSNGPYLVQGTIELRDAEGNVLDTAGKNAVALCRCGGSANKPFCDGTHGKNGFQGGSPSKS